MKNMFRLDNRLALVTGGARGIGRAVAAKLAEAGADVAIFDLLDASEAAEEIAHTCRVRTNAYRADVTDPESLRRCFDAVERDMGTPDVLFNNAGIGPHKDALAVTPEEWNNVIGVNLNGIFFTATEFARRLIAKKTGGSIINTASMSGLIVNLPQRQASYNASKAAIIHLTRTLAVEWAEYGIRVNSISPGYIATDMIASVDPAMRGMWEKMIPFGRMGTPEELAGAVIYFASDASSYTSGSNLVIDGCYTAV